MKKRTSKSVSGARKISLQSGTSARTVGTATNQAKKTARNMAEFIASIAESVRNMTPEEFQQSLVHSGIVSANGKLTSKYRR